MTNVRRPIAWSLTCFFLFAAGIAHGQMADFGEHRVVRVDIRTPQELDSVLGLTDDVWTESIGVGPLDIRVTPVQFALLKLTGLPFEVLIEDVQVLIDEQFNANLGVGAFDDYLPAEAVIKYLDMLANLRPDLAETFVVGQTLEGRDIVGIRITGPGGGEDKPGVLYHGVSHAREWITVPVNLYFADRLIRDYDKDATIRELVNRIEWFIVPIFNVDGYVYTWTTNRLWRKNRRNNGNGTWGVDLNRNWGVGWGGQGSSGDTGSQTYRGTAPFSEPETKAMSEFITAHPNIVTYNDVHNYGQLLLWPWGYKSELPPDHEDFAFVGQRAVDIIRGVHGTTYTHGSVARILYFASGVSIDWVYGEHGILAYSYECRDKGQRGFLLPKEQILPNAEELFPALLFQADWATKAVTIRFPNGLPRSIEPGKATELAVQIRPQAQDVDLEGASLFVRTRKDGSFSQYAIKHVSGELFTATFPARDCGDDTQFYVRAMGTGGGVVHSPSAAPNEFYSAPVGTRVMIVSDDFETDQGWTVVNAGGLTAGAWERATPTGGGGRGDPPTDYDKSGKCYLTENGPGNTDVDNGTTHLISPAIDLSGRDASISYARWYSNTEGDDPNNDIFVVAVSNDDGANWVTAEIVGPAGEQAGGGWFTHSFRVGEFVEPSAKVRVRFSASDLNAGSVVEAGLDAFEVFEFGCEGGPCDPCDANCDGSLDLTDVAPFIELMLGGDPCDVCTGDTNRDGSVDLADVERFLECLLG